MNIDFSIDAYSKLMAVLHVRVNGNQINYRSKLVTALSYLILSVYRRSFYTEDYCVLRLSMVCV